MKGILVLGRAALVGVALMVGGCGGAGNEAPATGPAQKKAPLVATQVVRTGDIAHRIRATGSVAYAEETEICPKVEQRILSLDVEEGDSVVKGQVLARLDPTELEAQKGQARAEIRVAEARRVDLQARARGQEIRAAQAAIVQAEGQLDAAVSILEDARRDLERQRQLFAIGGASQQEVDYARTRVESAEAQKGVAQAGLVAVRERLSLLEEGATRTQLALAGEQVAQSEARLAFWQSQADYCVVRAPISGVVTRRHQFVGDLASPRSPILTVANPARLVIRTSLPPDSAIRLRRGMPVFAVFDGAAGSRDLALRVDRVYPAANPETGLVTVEVAVPMPAGRIQVGSLVRLQIELEQHRGVVVVPGQAALTRPGGKVVAFVVRDGRAEERVLKIGLESGDRLEVLSGLAPGDRLVVGGQERIADGVEVNIQKPVDSSDKATGGRQ